MKTALVPALLLAACATEAPTPIEVYSKASVDSVGCHAIYFSAPVDEEAEVIAEHATVFADENCQTTISSVILPADELVAVYVKVNPDAERVTISIEGTDSGAYREIPVSKDDCGAECAPVGGGYPLEPFQTNTGAQQETIVGVRRIEAPRINQAIDYTPSIAVD